MKYIYVICIVFFSSYAIGSKGAVSTRIPENLSEPIQFKIRFVESCNALGELIFEAGEVVQTKDLRIDCIGRVTSAYRTYNSTTQRLERVPFSIGEDSAFQEYYSNINVQKVRTTFNAHVKRVRIKRIVGIGLLFLSIYEWYKLLRTLYPKNKKERNKKWVATHATVATLSLGAGFYLLYSTY